MIEWEWEVHSLLVLDRSQCKRPHAVRLVATLLRELGYVDAGIVEVQRADLVAGYVGQTALKTRDVINKAKGGGSVVATLRLGCCCRIYHHAPCLPCVAGVLFIDEAYTLIDESGQDQYGREAVQTLLKRMEDQKMFGYLSPNVRRLDKTARCGAAAAVGYDV